MKKTVIFILLYIVAALAVDPPFDSTSGGDTSMCYVPKQSNSSANKDLCSYMETQKSLAVDICEFAPELPGFTKKKNTLSFDTDKHMEDFCNQNTTKQAQSAIKDIDIFSQENNFNFGASSNGTDDAEKKAGQFFDTKGSPKEVMKNSESVSRQALYSGNQKVMREAVNYAKNSNTSISNVTLKELSAPSNYTQYLLDRKALVKGSFSDHFSQSPLAVTSEARNKVQGISDAKKAINATQQITANASDKIDFGTNKRIQLYIDASARDSDYAIPTQEMVKLLRDDVKAEAIANIKQQMKREALVISENMQIAQARKDLLTIAGNKATVITRPFNTTEATKKIDDLIDTSSSQQDQGNFFNPPVNPPVNPPFDPSDPTTWTSFDPNDPSTWPIGFDPDDPSTYPIGFDPGDFGNGNDPSNPETETGSKTGTFTFTVKVPIPILVPGTVGMSTSDLIKRANQLNLQAILNEISLCIFKCSKNGNNGYIEICGKKCIDDGLLKAAKDGIDLNELLHTINTLSGETEITVSPVGGTGLIGITANSTNTTKSNTNTNTGDNNDAGSGANANTTYIGEDNSYGGGD